MIKSHYGKVIFAILALLAIVLGGQHDEKVFGVSEILPIEIDGKMVYFTYTDSTFGEDLLIATDNAYCNGLTSCELYVAIKNLSGKNQNDIDFSFLFENDKSQISKVELLVPNQQIPYEVTDYENQCMDVENPDGDLVNQCFDVDIGTHTAFRTGTRVIDVPLDIITKQVDRFSADKKIRFNLPKDATYYARLTFKHAPNSSGQFLLSADNGTAQGILDPWWDADWAYKVKITSDNTLVDESWASKPILVDLSNMPAGFFTNTNASGSDIRVLNTSEDTELSYELVNFSQASSTGELWFSVDTMASTSDADFYIYYGNAGASSNSTSGIWTSEYKAVFHYDSSNLVDDASPNGNDLTNNNSVGSTSGKIGTAADFGSSNTTKYFNTNDLGIAGGAISESVWVQVQNQPAASKGQYVNIQADTGVDVANYIRYFNSSGTYQVNFTRAKACVGDQASTVTQTLTNNTWYQLVYTYDATNIRGYLNGALITGPTAASGTGSCQGEGFYVGIDDAVSAGFYLQGLADENHVRNTAISRGVIKTEYNNQSDNASFWTFGSQQENGVTASGGRIIFMGEM